VQLDEETIEIVKCELAGMKQEIHTLEAEIEALRREAPARPAESPRDRARRIVGRIMDFKRVIEKGTPQERKEFIRLFVSDIRVDAEKGEVSVGFYMPSDPAQDTYGWVWCPQRGPYQRGTPFGPVAVPPSCAPAQRSASFAKPSSGLPWPPSMSA